MTYIVKEGADAPWEFQLLDRRGPVDLTTAQSVQIYMYPKGGGTAEIDGGLCTVDDALTGKISYPPLLTEVDAVGDYDVQFTVTWSDNRKDKFPSRRGEKFFALTIEESLD